ncbi:hypothetical protein [Pseudomonas sp. NFIX28]|uniref:hypothetical protein n=1 Tax=Pseudomonas sp. NFIX28 TaxID=1566235 RepID=UPI000B882C0B|nr:hypothetical protein [Pseudomonas sp. NFIX28]
MKDKDLVRSYINNFRRHMARYLLPNVSLKATAILAKDDGGVVKFAFEVNGQNSDEIKRGVDSIGDAILELGLKTFGDPRGISFSGTNVVMEKDSMYLIKGGDPKLWGDSSAKADVAKIVGSSRSSKK